MSIRSITGLGLAISSGLIALMGGRLSLEGEPGRASVFSFDLPYVAVLASTPAAGPAGDGPAAAETRSLDVLVAEDNRVNQIVVALAQRSRLGPVVCSLPETRWGEVRRALLTACGFGEREPG